LSDGKVRAPESTLSRVVVVMKGRRLIVSAATAQEYQAHQTEANKAAKHHAKDECSPAVTAHGDIYARPHKNHDPNRPGQKAKQHHYYGNYRPIQPSHDRSQCSGPQCPEIALSPPTRIVVPDRRSLRAERPIVLHINDLGNNVMGNMRYQHWEGNMHRVRNSA
jgi:hypothetical protein